MHVVMLAGLFCAAASLPAAAVDLVKEQATSTINISKDASGLHVRSVARFYLYNSFIASTVESTATAPAIRQLILVEKTKSLRESDQLDAANDPGQVKVTVYPLTEKGKGAPRITIDSVGDDVAVDSSYLTLTRYGCCVEGTTKAVYSLESGKYLFNTTGDQWATLGAKGGFAMTRIAVAHVAPTAMDDVLFKGEKRGAAIISYASPTAPLQRVMLLVPPGADASAALDWSADLAWVSADYPDGTNHIYVDRTAPADQVFSGMILRFHLSDENDVDIPLSNDRLDIAAAKLPDGFSLKEMPLP